MIRPRGGNFVYTDDELNIMKKDIEVCKQIGVDGIVFGILTDKNQINIEQSKELIELAKPLPVTFHKAFDDSSDPLSALEDIIASGATRILTSGVKDTANEGKEMLNTIINQANGRITIVAAGKVTKENVDLLSQQINTSEFHGKRIV